MGERRGAMDEGLRALTSSCHPTYSTPVNWKKRTAAHRCGASCVTALKAVIRQMTMKQLNERVCARVGRDESRGWGVRAGGWGVRAEGGASEQEGGASEQKVGRQSRRRRWCRGMQTAVRRDARTRHSLYRRTATTSV